MPKIYEIATGEKGPGNIIDETVLSEGGATTATTPAFTDSRNLDTTTNTAPTVRRFKRKTTGTPANGIGAGIDFEVQTGAANHEIGAVIQAVSTDVTAASEDFDIVTKVMKAGAAAVEVLRIKSTGAISILNGVDTLTFAALGTYNSTISTPYSLDITAGTTGSGGGLGTPDSGLSTKTVSFASNPNGGGDPNGCNWSRSGFHFGRHASNRFEAHIMFAPNTTDNVGTDAVGDFAITAQGCLTTAVNNPNGGKLRFIGGQGPSAANGNGGTVNLAGGLGYGTGFTGDVNIAYTGSAAQGGAVFWGLRAQSAAAPTIASAGTIAPTTQILFVSGVAAIATITAPRPISLGGGTIIVIPTGIFTWTAAGNIAIAGTAVVSKAIHFTYDVTTAKFYPSYV